MIEFQLTAEGIYSLNISRKTENTPKYNVKSYTHEHYRHSNSVIF